MKICDLHRFVQGNWLLLVPAKPAVSSSFAVVLFLSACQACSGPKDFGYNTAGVVASNLVGTYKVDETTWVLERKGFTNLNGTIVLNSDNTFQFTSIPCVGYMGGTNVYSMSAGTWRIRKEKEIWVVEALPSMSTTICGYGQWSLPVLGDSPPYGLQLYINDNEGYWVRYAKAQNDH
jgi:hypothetical protein